MYKGGFIHVVRQGSSRGERIVALLPPGSTAPELPDGLAAVITTSGYEAAAELLAAPAAAALLVDLGRITPHHRRLLALAGEMDVPIVAYGVVSATLKGELLRSLHLVTRDSAGEVIAQLIATTKAVAKPTVSPAPPKPPVGEYKPVAAEAPASPADLLTDAELKALLEDQP